MSLIERFLQSWLPASEEEVIHTSKPPEKPKPARKFDAIRMAVEDRLNNLLREEIPEHREIAKEDALQLYYVEIECSETGEALLTNFFKDFNHAARKGWIRDILGQNGFVNLDCFSGLHSNADLPEVGTLDKHEQILNHGASPIYRVHLHGRWIQPLPVRESPQLSGLGVPVTLTVHDDKGTRCEQLARYPIKIGRGADCDLPVSGRYSSREHCTLHSDGRKIWLEESSTHGTWLNGEKVHPKTRVELDANRYQLKLGNNEGEVKDYPEIVVEIKRAAHAGDNMATPMIQLSNITPIDRAADSLLAVLSIEDITGNPQHEVSHLPFSIGRVECDYTTPRAHAGVSGKHLHIVAFTDSGASVSNEAHCKNGTSLDDALQPESFDWPFNGEIVLAPKWENDPAVRITLKRPE